MAHLQPEYNRLAGGAPRAVTLAGGRRPSPSCGDRTWADHTRSVTPNVLQPGLARDKLAATVPIIPWGCVSLEPKGIEHAR